MINHIIGSVKSTSGQSVIVDVGPFGLDIQVASPELFPAGLTVQIFTYVHWNQENGPSLFGFSTELERTVFLLIIDCPGIGPKLGLAALAHLGPDGFLHAVVTDDARALSSVSGIGARKAEQMIVQLKHKASKLLESGVIVGSAKEATQHHAVTQALMSLNYTRAEISDAMKYVNSMSDGLQAPFDQLLRQALGYLSKRI